MNLIDRDKLIMHIEDCRLSESITWEEAELITDFLLNSPTVESRPKGKWEDFSCSLCGFTPLIKPMAIDTTKGLIMCTYKYCPSCGAEMECEE